MANFKPIHEKKPLEKPDWSALFAEALLTPGRMSEAYSVFHDYSIGNMWLASWQLATRNLPCSPIASYKRWQELGRQVKKGEKAIALYMPITGKRHKTEGDGDDEDKEERFTFFALKHHWFSLDQTEGEPYVKEVAIPEWDRAQALSRLEIEEIAFEKLNGNWQGVAYPVKKQLAINPMAAMPWKTTFHEMAHCLLHGAETRLEDGSCLIEKHIRECEAESVAYLCCATLGLPGLEESRGYIQDWLKHGSQAEEFAKKSASRVFSAANKILKAGCKAESNEVPDE